jgi:GntR family transcriptional regulator/MocR family aminotransferase
LRRVRRKNSARRHALPDAIHTDLGDRVEVTGNGAGAHVVLWPRHCVAEEAGMADAATRGVGIYAISPYLRKQPSQTGFMVGYSRMRETEIREGVRRVGEVL